MSEKKARPKPIDHLRGVPIWARNDKGQPICGARKRWNAKLDGPQPDDWNPICQQTRGLCGNGRCAAHQGRRGPSKAVVVALHNREQFLNHIGGNGIVAAQIADKVVELAKAGNWDAIKWALEQQFGGPKQTVENIIGDRDMLARVFRVTARHLKGDAYNLWVEDLQRDLGYESAT